MKNNKIFLFAALLALIAPSAMQAQQVSLDTMMNHIRELSSSRYDGRLAGSDGYWRAADYVADALSRYGVQPYKGDWTQLFEVECNEIENCTFNTYVNANDTRTSYILGNDFSCVGMTGRGYADAPVVFCGYGIDAPVFDEYAKVDAQGKIVVVLSGTPNFLPSMVTKNYATPRDKARVARRHGACALVVVNMSSSCPANEVQGRVFSGDLPHLPTFPIIQPTKACAARLFNGELMGFQQAVDSLQNSMQPVSFHFRKHFEIEVNAKYHPCARTCNVVGIYPGTDRKMSNEYIVVGAHLDHVGMQGNTCIFPGADDNASGVAALLETARLLQSAVEQPKRSVVFVLFGAGETQSLGSQVFVSNFKPLRNIDAFVNIECIGSGDSVVVMGNHRFPLLYQVAYAADTEYTQIMANSFKTDPKGDAQAFATVGIPSINITNLNGNRHNHVPSDIPENIDRAFLVRSATLAFQTIYELTFGDYQGRSNLSRKVTFDK